jgi:Ca2+-binding EF-hand superfamily protein
MMIITHLLYLPYCKCRATVEEMSEEFKVLDTRLNGYLEREKFLLCIQNYGFKLRKEVARDLIESLTDHIRAKGRESNGKKNIDYNDFILALSVENEAGEDDEDSLEKLRERMKRKSKIVPGMQEVSQCVKMLSIFFVLIH